MKIDFKKKASDSPGEFLIDFKFKGTLEEFRKMIKEYAGNF